MKNIFVIFANEQTATANIAGLPLAARSILAVDRAVTFLTQKPNIILVLCNGSLDDKWSKDEIDRLIANSKPNIIQYDEIDRLDIGADDIFIVGEHLIGEKLIEKALSSFDIAAGHTSIFNNPQDILKYYNGIDHDEFALNAAIYRKKIMRATIKPTDGIVSRKINRPMSMAISALLLQSNKVRPIHATFATAMTAIIMLICFLSGSYIGMIAGAILFQTASMLDGVDGEIARATLRSSDFGASLDSMTDAATNLFFIGGLGFSLYSQGTNSAILMALMGVICLGAGMFLLGKQAVASGEHINFDGLKEMVFQSDIPFSNWLVWITMRDFLALASAIMVICGFGILFLQIFACGSILWLLVAIFKVAKG